MRFRESTRPGSARRPALPLLLLLPVLAVAPLRGQGITAVTRRTLMAGPAGGQGGGALWISPQQDAAAQALLPSGPAPARPAAALAPTVPAPVLVSRPAAVVTPEEREARRAAAAAAVLAFHQEQARKGSPSAQLALGRRYLTGDGVERNPAVARAWLTAAAQNGLTEAADLLSRMGTVAGAAGK